ncbi:MAG: hypothetical protein LBB13_02805, partial [Rickettsiales bacterium]|nr:hypothetical protein [Rickettsiales bacterium]
MRVFVISVLKRLAVVISCCYCAGAVFAANSIWELRKEIIKEGSNEESIKYFTKDKSSRYVADFKTKGHVNVLDSNTDQLYDSSSGDGAAEKQYGGTCPVNTYDNIFYLEMMGDIYYTEFSRRLRPTKDFYLFYTFAVMYDFIKKEGKNFKDFDI